MWIICEIQNVVNKWEFWGTIRIKINFQISFWSTETDKRKVQRQRKTSSWQSLKTSSSKPTDLTFLLNKLHCISIKILSGSDALIHFTMPDAKCWWDTLVEIFNNIYETGKIPKDLLNLRTYTEKTNANRCDEYRMISLLSQVFTRLYNRCERLYTVWIQERLRHTWSALQLDSIT